MILFYDLWAVINSLHFIEETTLLRYQNIILKQKVLMSCALFFMSYNIIKVYIESKRRTFYPYT